MRPKLFASEALVPRCFGPSEGGLDTTAYGPFNDVRAPRPTHGAQALRDF